MLEVLSGGIAIVFCILPLALIGCSRSDRDIAISGSDSAKPTLLESSGLEELANGEESSIFEDVGHAKLVEKSSLDNASKQGRLEVSAGSVSDYEQASSPKGVSSSNALVANKAIPAKLPAADKVLWQSAQALIANNQHSVAIEKLNLILETNPVFVDAFIARAKCNELEGETDSAINDYRAAQKLLPESTEIGSRLAVVLLKHDRTNDAAGAAKEVLDIDGKSSIATAVIASSEVRILKEKLKSGLIRLEGSDSYVEACESNFRILANLLSSEPSNPDILSIYADAKTSFGSGIIAANYAGFSTSARKLSLDAYKAAVDLHAKAVGLDERLISSHAALFHLGFVLNLDSDKGKSSLETLLAIAPNLGKSILGDFVVLCWQGHLLTDEEQRQECEDLLFKHAGHCEPAIREALAGALQNHDRAVYALENIAATGFSGSVPSDVREGIRKDNTAIDVFNRVLKEFDANKKQIDKNDL